MQSNDIIEVVTPLGGGNSEVTLIPGCGCRSCGHGGCIGGAGPAVLLPCVGFFRIRWSWS
jgi:hypothetical protein